MSDSSSIPETRIESSRGASPRRSLMWLVTFICILIALLLSFGQFWEPGSMIRITFKQGHGLKPGDRLRYRGIDVGEVERVEIRPDLEGIRVHVRLESAAEALAREGSQFWIVRPQLRLNQLAGVETVGGAQDLAVRWAILAKFYGGGNAPGARGRRDDAERRLFPSGIWIVCR